jgi:hypothetical protein
MIVFVNNYIIYYNSIGFIFLYGKCKKEMISFSENKFVHFTRRQHQFFCLEQATIAEWQGAREGEKCVAKPTQSNRKLFLINGVYIFNSQRQQQAGSLPWCTK